MKEHGFNEYRRGCRCDVCKKANADYCREYRERRRNGPIPGDIHGTTGGYTNYACRCEMCVLAHRKAAQEYMPGWRERNREHLAEYARNYRARRRQEEEQRNRARKTGR